MIIKNKKFRKFLGKCPESHKPILFCLINAKKDIEQGAGYNIANCSTKQEAHTIHFN